MNDFGSARAALQSVRDQLLDRSNVVAAGIGFKETDGVRTGEVGIVCSVERKVPSSELSASDLIPRSIAGVSTDVVATGILRALLAHRERHRPAPGGVSIAHRDVTAGTLGCVVRRGGERFVLSNNHVLANSNLGRAGDPILQPAPYDDGTLSGDTIATLEQFVTIEMLEEESTCGAARRVAAVMNWLARATGSNARLMAMSARAPENLVDAALARPVMDDLLAEGILGIGPIAGQGVAELGMRVRKSGRTTGVSTGEIVQVQVTADVLLGQRTARFTDQVMAGAMSQGGDSGSLVVDDEGNAVGLLFAGSETTTLCNRIEHVLAALEVSL